MECTDPCNSIERNIDLLNFVLVIAKVPFLSVKTLAAC